MEYIEKILIAIYEQRVSYVQKFSPRKGVYLLDGAYDVTSVIKQLIRRGLVASPPKRFGYISHNVRKK